jgi:hypothetical protein
MDGLTGGKSERILCTSVCVVWKKCRFLAADEWIERKWPKIIAEYSPEDTYNAAKEDSTFVLCLSILICLKMKVLKDLNL